MLTLEKSPFLMTLLIGILSYQLNYVINRERSLPILAVDRSTHSKTKLTDTTERRVIFFELKNVSDTPIRHLDLVFAFATDSAEEKIPYPLDVTSVNAVPMAPSSFFDSATEKVLANDQGGEVHFPVLMPENRYRVIVTTRQHHRAEKYPKIYVNCDQPLRLRSYGLRVWLSENGFWFNLGFIVLWVGLLIIYLWKYPKIQQHAESKNNAKA
jgi:hypothetical protein